jgi:leucyl aminopeptidase (aminopeptidase T)
MLTNSGSKMNSLPAMVADWTTEAVSKHGFDWKKISAHLRQKINSLPPEERVRLEQEVALTAVEQPAKGPNGLN